MAIEFREVKLKQSKKLDDKVDKRRQIRAVIVDSLGNQSGSGSIWADQNARRLWVMPLGATQPFQCLCVRLGAPVIGLGVIVGYIEGSNTLEVLRDDYEFLGPSNNGRSYLSPTNTDFQPGGALQLWLASKLIQPLSTYPSATGLTVNVVAGDYPYSGTRKTFPGQTSFALTINPNPGEHYLAGLYLDSANSLQVVYGASVSTTINPPPEPTWPAGAFRLSVVRINDTQTSITLASDTDTTNDIFDRRLAWSDESSGVGTEDIIRIRVFN